MSSRPKIELLNQPKYAARIVINVHHDGNVEVKGFPMQFGAAMEIMSSGMKAVAAFFLNAAMQGKLSQAGQAEQSSILSN